MALQLCKGRQVLGFSRRRRQQVLYLRNFQRLPFSTIKQGKLNHFLHLLLKNSTTQQPIQQLHALLLISGLLNHSLQLFNTLLRCYSLSDHPHHSLFLYNQLQHTCSYSRSFDSFTYTFLINAATNASIPAMGTLLHCLTTKMGFQNHVYVQTSLVRFYLASRVSGCALLVFDEMPDRNSVTWNVMITGLVNCGELGVARRLFGEMPGKNVVSWTGMIDGYVRMKRYSEALALFRRMVLCEGIMPSEITILSILPAISNFGELKGCRLIHGYGEKMGFNEFDIRVANSIIDTYAKCGCIASASRFFEEVLVHRKNLVSWTSIISGFAMYGMGKEAVEHFERMEKRGLRPNRVTFLSLLSACSHGGLVEEGLKLVEKMVNEYHVLPDSKHYGCLVDMLGRTGRLEEAEKMALAIPGESANAVIWRTLLGACSFHGNVEMGKRVTEKIMEIDKKYGADYVLMYNIYAGVGRFDDAERSRKLMDERNASKVPGHSLI